jgi:hypothetical protein
LSAQANFSNRISGEGQILKWSFAPQSDCPITQTAIKATAPNVMTAVIAVALCDFWLLEVGFLCKVLVITTSSFKRVVN